MTVLQQEDATKLRKYVVSGTDDLGDVHTFSTDDRERAEEVAAIMGEDLFNVELIETEFGAAKIADERQLMSLAEQNFTLDPSLDGGI